MIVMSSNLWRCCNLVLSWLGCNLATCGGVELVGSLQPLVVPPSRLVVPSSASLPSYPLSTIIIMITIIIFMIME